MELGNMCFGHSRGNYDIDRDIYEPPFYRLIEAGPDEFIGYYACEPFENDVFSYGNYDWGAVCTCGVEAVIDKWCDEHPHVKTCVHAKISKKRNEMESRGLNYFKEPGKAEFDAWLRSEGIPEAGCFVMCDCGRDAALDRRIRRIEGAVMGHHSDCRVVQPNFFYTYTGYSLMWYKYPLRNAYANKDLSVKDFTAMIEHCIESL